jgi:catechol 2,3-dioxygenase-like lactoylglutathione lyase family enzyme
MAWLGAAAQLRTTDLERSIRFYAEVLGLALAFRYEDFYAGIAAGPQIFHLKQVDAADASVAEIASAGHLHLFLETDDIESVAARLAAHGVAPVRPLHATPWGTREIILCDDQGHTIHVGEVTR